MSDLGQSEKIVRNWSSTSSYITLEFPSMFVKSPQKESRVVFNLIPRYAIAEFVAMIIGIVISLAVLIYSFYNSPEIAPVFLVPLATCLFGIVFMIVKRS